MIGIFLVVIASLFAEGSTAIGKYEVAHRRESIFLFAFLNCFWGVLVFAAIAFFRGEFVFSMASIPTLLLRAGLEIAQVHVTMLAIVHATRSTNGFLRSLTIPLVLAIEVASGVSVSVGQMIGVGLIIVAFVLLLFTHNLTKKGIGFVLFSTVNSAFTIMLYKYHITNYNSVEAEQGTILAVLLVYLYANIYFRTREHPLRALRKGILLLQSGLHGVALVVDSFAFLFAPASFIVASSRAADVIWSIASGSLYFHERHLLIKILAFLLLAGGIFSLALAVAY